MAGETYSTDVGVQHGDYYWVGSAQVTGSSTPITYPAAQVIYLISLSLINCAQNLDHQKMQ